ncbi:MAG: hypothetical protein KDC84_01525 [Crocinitomicaceae bacterium]|nr:hypothetical protein [Crocinitomicaceae bacterium]
MHFGFVITVLLTGTWKFMFTPALSFGLGFNFLETWVLSCGGAVFSAFIFYYSADFFMLRAARKRKEKYHQALAKGITIPRKKQMTRMNKIIVILKKKVGWYAISFWVPLFLSIPIGSIIVAKFYGKRLFTFPLIVIGILLNGLIITTISYFILG